MDNNDLFLGLDTSNYTTSAAIINCNNEILQDKRIQLIVGKGERGLRQSSALYQHWENLPLLLDPLLKRYSKQLKAVCVSQRPRPIKGSYMPVFNAGNWVAKIVASTLNIPMFGTSHQEGHLKSGAYNTSINFAKPLIAAHISGGTLELIALDKNRFEIIGGTKDISYGQILDRIGVSLGLSFPAGKEMDTMAISSNLKGIKNPLTAVFFKETWINLSGAETQIECILKNYSKEEISAFIFERIAENLILILNNARKIYSVDQILITGGVASSIYLRKKLTEAGFILGNLELCSDNAVGVALLKGKSLCQ
ncbi:MAG TPA: hypothetical protein VFD03_11225 [Clostridia bacterium]|nr:hypothetical protein [Clostridia bacterium]